MWIISQSATHASYSVRQVTEFVLPILSLQQFRIFRCQDEPVGLALWANVDDDISKILASTPNHIDTPLSSSNLSSGRNCWLLYLIVASGIGRRHEQELMFADLVTGPLRGIEVQTWMQLPKPEGWRVVKLDSGIGDNLVYKLNDLYMKGPQA